MNRHQLFFILAVVLIAFGTARAINIFNHDPNFSPQAAETNATFVTSDGHVLLSYNTGKVDPAKVEWAKKSRESLPAEDFPEGNWGAVLHGAQISLRFDKRVYTNGEPINARVLVRNITNEFFIFIHTNTFYLPFDFTARTKSNEIISPKPHEEELDMPREQIVIPGTQREYAGRLNNTYDLTNGNYLVEASILTIIPSLGSNTLKSAKVPIEIR